MKRRQALVAAAVITAIITLGILGIGVNATLNPNSVPVSDNPLQARSLSNDQSAQIQQARAIILQYQRELAVENSQLEQMQSILLQLQRAGVIRILSDGTILVNRTSGGGFTIPAPAAQPDPGNTL
jgi:hypothetical protein